MANYKAIASGNWSNLAIWQDSSSGAFLPSTVLPTVNDSVYLNNFIIQADIDITIDKLLSAAITGVVAGGNLAITTNRIIVANTEIRSTLLSGDVIDISGTGLNVSITSLNIYGFAFNCIELSTTNSVLNINGNMTASPSSNTGYALNITGTNNIVNITGSQFTGGTNNASTIRVTAINNVLNITGNQISNHGQTAILFNSSGNLNIVGNQISTSTGHSVTFQTGTQLISIVGNQQGSNVGGRAIQSLSTTTITIIGNCYAGTNTAAIYTSTLLNYRGGIYNNGTKTAIVAEYLIVQNTSDTFFVIKENTGSSMATFANTTSIPNPINVRQGINYTAGNIGTLIVPSPSNVRKGVPTDATVGTADLSAADMWNYLTSAITTPGSIGETVKNIKLKTDDIPDNPASVESVGAIVASYNV